MYLTFSNDIDSSSYFIWIFKRALISYLFIYLLPYLLTYLLTYLLLNHLLIYLPLDSKSQEPWSSLHHIPILAYQFFPSSVYLHSVPVSHSLPSSHRRLISCTCCKCWHSFKSFHGFIYSYNMYQPLKTFALNILYQTGVLYISLTSWLVLCLHTCSSTSFQRFRQIFLSHIFNVTFFSSDVHHFCTTVEQKWL